jgi:hypothetical protein
MKALVPWRPFRELSTLHQDIDDLFNRFFGETEEWWPTAAWRGVGFSFAPVWFIVTGVLS